MASVNALIDKLLQFPGASVAEAGTHLLGALSGGELGRDDFISDPLALGGPPYFASRYLAQVVLRALNGQYETVEEVVSSLAALVERNPPILEPKRGPDAGLTVYFTPLNPLCRHTTEGRDGSEDEIGGKDLLAALQGGAGRDTEAAQAVVRVAREESA